MNLLKGQLKTTLDKPLQNLCYFFLIKIQMTQAEVVIFDDRLLSIINPPRKRSNLYKVHKWSTNYRAEHTADCE